VKNTTHGAKPDTHHALTLSPASQKQAVETDVTYSVTYLSALDDARLFLALIGGAQ